MNLKMRSGAGGTRNIPIVVKLCVLSIFEAISVDRV